MAKMDDISAHADANSCIDRKPTDIQKAPRTDLNLQRQQGNLSGETLKLVNELIAYVEEKLVV